MAALLQIEVWFQPLAMAPWVPVCVTTAPIKDDVEARQAVRKIGAMGFMELK